MSDFQDYLKKALEDPEFRADYEALEPIYTIKRQLIEARIQQHLTQEEIAERTGMKRSAIARLERGDSNPTIKSLQKLAAALGKKLTITFS